MISKKLKDICTIILICSSIFLYIGWFLFLNISAKINYSVKNVKHNDLDWKDEWIENWIERKIKKVKVEPKNEQLWNMSDGCNGFNKDWRNNITKYYNKYLNDTKFETTKFNMYQYIPARCNNASIIVKPQLISRVIWQTWKSSLVGVKQYKSMSSIILYNPDYEYILFTDDDCKEFICKFYDLRVQKAYAILRPGAAKADLWRLTIILKYGGVYIDSDVSSLKSLSHLIQPNSSIVSGIGGNKDLHQWILAYRPNHPFIREALNVIVKSVLDTYEQRGFVPVIKLTGPDNFHFNGVVPVLHRNNCTVDLVEAAKFNLELVKQGHPCSQQDKPENIGIVQLFDRDKFNMAFVFKVAGVDTEKLILNPGYVRYSLISKFEQLFHDSKEYQDFCRP